MTNILNLPGLRVLDMKELNAEFHVKAEPVAVSRMCPHCGQSNGTIHDLRAMSGTEAEAQGIDAQRLLGHADGKMTRRYLRDKTVPVVEGPRRRTKNEKSA